jgi:hypothetical protein
MIIAVTSKVNLFVLKSLQKLNDFKDYYSTINHDSISYSNHNHNPDSNSKPNSKPNSMPNSNPNWNSKSIYDTVWESASSTLKALSFLNKIVINLSNCDNKGDTNGDSNGSGNSNDNETREREREREIEGSGNSNDNETRKDHYRLVFHVLKDLTGKSICYLFSFLFLFFLLSFSSNPNPNSNPNPILPSVLFLIFFIALQMGTTRQLSILSYQFSVTFFHPSNI